MNNADFLKSTCFCNSDDPQIRSLSQSITAGSFDQREAVGRLFLWVRDRIIYRVGLWSHSGSETLAIGYGSCINKANLLVALLRSAGIPAGFCIRTVKGQDCLGPIVPPFFKNLLGKRFRHVYCCVKLDGSWQYIDPSQNAEFVQRTGHINLVDILIEWDSRRNSLPSIEAVPIRKFFDIDTILAPKRRNTKGILLKAGNLYIDFLRQNKTPVADLHHLQCLFLSWLRRTNHYGIFGLFQASLYCRAMREWLQRCPPVPFGHKKYQQDEKNHD